WQSYRQHGYSRGAVQERGVHLTIERNQRRYHMRTVGYAAFVVFCLVVFAALPANAQYSVQSVKTMSADQTTHISEDLTVTGSNPVDGLRVNDYFYEANPSSIRSWTVTPTAITPDPLGGVVGVSNLDRT